MGATSQPHGGHLEGELPASSSPGGKQLQPRPEQQGPAAFSTTPSTPIQPSVARTGLGLLCPGCGPQSVHLGVPVHGAVSCYYDEGTELP